MSGHLSSARLDLLLVGRDFMDACLAGRMEDAEEIVGVELPAGWADEHEFVLSLRSTQIQGDPAAAEWLLRLLVLRETREYVGYVNFHAPPGNEKWVEIGYEIEPRHRRKGYAQEAFLKMLEWASARGVLRIRASIRPDNAPSLAMIHKLGLLETGEQWDEIDGRELVFEADIAEVLDT